MLFDYIINGTAILETMLSISTYYWVFSHMKTLMEADCFMAHINYHKVIVLMEWVASLTSLPPQTTENTVKWYS